MEKIEMFRVNWKLSTKQKELLNYRIAMTLIGVSFLFGCTIFSPSEQKYSQTATVPNHINSEPSINNHSSTAQILEDGVPISPTQSQEEVLSTLTDQINVLDIINGDFDVSSQQSEIISTENAKNLRKYFQFGLGNINEIVWSPNGKNIVVGNDSGIFIFDSETLIQEKYIDTRGIAVESIAYSSDGLLLASGFYDGTVILWSTENWQPIGKLGKHTKAVSSLAFNPDGTILVSGSFDGTVNLWNINSKLQLLTMETNDPIYSVAFSPTEKWVAAGGINAVYVWDIDSGNLINQIEGSQGESFLRFSPNGKSLALGGHSDSLQMWDTDTWQQSRGILVSSDRRITTMQFSPDGLLIATAHTNNTINLWDAESKENILEIEVSFPGGWSFYKKCLTFSPDGRKLAMGTLYGTITLFDSQNGNTIRSLDHHYGRLESIVFSTNGRVIASSSSDETIRFWNVQDGQLLSTLQSEAVNGLTFSPDEKLIAGRYDVWKGGLGLQGKTEAWAIGSGQSIGWISKYYADENYFSEINMISFSPDFKSVVTGEGGVIELWNVENKKNIFSVKIGSDITWLVFTPDGSGIIAGSEEGQLYVLDAINGKQLEIIEAHNDLIAEMTFSNDGSMLTSRYKDNTILIWDTKSWQKLQVVDFINASIFGMNYSPGNNLLAICHTGGITLWDIKNNKNRFSQDLILTEGFPNSCRAFTFSPDGQLFVWSTGFGHGENNLFILDTQRAELVASFALSGIYSLAFSPDGRILVSGSDNGALSLYNIHLPTGHDTPIAQPKEILTANKVITKDNLD
ncbi:MAG: WD40 repeat domain-containing protein, partial [Anaerolineaceae bacterium]|nr:WD40 repeat domain-containing protein [Anaerolineaceae bacterium]